MWILQLAGGVLCAAAIIVAVWRVPRWVRGWAYDWRHAEHLIAEVQRADWGAGFERGSMTLDEERAYVNRAGGAYVVRADGVYAGPDGGQLLRPFDPPHGLDGPGFDDGTILYNGHTLTCTQPDEDHPGACPEEGDWPDERDWPVPDVPNPWRSPAVEAGPDVIDAVLALEAADPENAGWTDQLLADLRDAPTSLDEIQAEADRLGIFGPLTKVCAYCDSDLHSSEDHFERLADTGEIAIVTQRADYAAELDEQDADAADFISRLKSDATRHQLGVISSA